MSTKSIGRRINARCTHCGARNMQITEEFIDSSNYEVQAGKVSAVTPAYSLKATGRQRGHKWVFRKNPLA